MKRSQPTHPEQEFAVTSMLAKTYGVPVTDALDESSHELVVGYKTMDLTVGWDPKDEAFQSLKIKPGRVVRIWPITDKMRDFPLGPGENTNGVEKKPRIHPSANTMIKYIDANGKTAFAFVKTRLDDVFNDTSRRDARTTLFGALRKTVAGITGRKEKPIVIESASAEASLLMACVDRIPSLSPAPEKRPASRGSPYFEFTPAY